ncbi:DNA damage-regulated autophagy modulator protein 1-like [Stegodyphus dumicola]|uniref:DNA damage-regulated autophagy modulator protein 1-like n=1 Tax=Stegodyphus dumicola TaxID=202533 RepID=UPI0015AD31AA|nr:DNA damage-regulated autophagy modulator protein 1-like [Stegodyphus dumicola]
MFVRFLIVDELNRGSEKAIDALNKASIIIGFIALMGMVIVAAYPVTTASTDETSIGAVHGVGANVLFIGGVIYAALQTSLSFKMSPYYNGRTICYIRLVITILSALSLITMTILLPFGFQNWSSGSHDHWTGSKMPYDKGFGLLVASSVAEWLMAIFFLAYYFTFIREFGKVFIHLRVQLLVNHFDEEPHEGNIVVASERTPIVT